MPASPFEPDGFALGQGSVPALSVAGAAFWVEDGMLRGLILLDPDGCGYERSILRLVCRAEVDTAVTFFGEWHEPEQPSPDWVHELSVSARPDDVQVFVVRIDLNAPGSLQLVQSLASADCIRVELVDGRTFPGLDLGYDDVELDGQAWEIEEMLQGRAGHPALEDAHVQEIDGATMFVPEIALGVVQGNPNVELWAAPLAAHPLFGRHPLVQQLAARVPEP